MRWIGLAVLLCGGLFTGTLAAEAQSTDQARDLQGKRLQMLPELTQGNQL